MAKNQDLPGVEGEGVSRKVIKPIEAAVDAWRDIVEKRMALTVKECAARDKVIALMHEHEIHVYQYDDRKIELVAGKEKVKVKTVDGEEDEDDD